MAGTSTLIGGLVCELVDCDRTDDYRYVFLCANLGDCKVSSCDVCFGVCVCVCVCVRACVYSHRCLALCVFVRNLGYCKAL